MKSKKWQPVHSTQKQTVDTPIGPLIVEYCEQGLHVIQLPNNDRSQDSKSQPEGSNKPNPAVTWIQTYFNKQEAHATKNLINDPTLYPPICWESLSYLTEFAQDVLKGALEKVKYGQTVSYGELAKVIGHEGASRAVGTALKNNPISIVIPCHRIIRSSGAYGNYSGGTRNSIKEFLIQHECNHPI